MDTRQLNDKQVALLARICSVHRTSLRRKLDRLTRGDPERSRVLDELEDTQELAALFEDEDLDRLSAA
jgi:hypothetical protein